MSEYEAGYYPSAPNKQRYEKIARFATIGAVKAGWLIKKKGYWFLTDEGKHTYEQFSDPEEFYREADRLYHIWKKSRVTEKTPVIENEEVEERSFSFEEAEEEAWEQIQEYLTSMNPYEFQNLVADLLDAMKYHVSWIAPPGKDMGIDIIAYTDPLGASSPRIKVQVKRKEQATNVDGLRAFMSVLGKDDLGIFVSLGGFTKDADIEARTQETRKVTLIDLESLFELWVEYYDKLNQDAKLRLPLKPIYYLAPEE